MRLIKTLDKIDEVITKSVIVVAALAMTITFIVMVVQVFLRRVFNAPIIWAEDLSVFFFIWITFLGAAVLFQRKMLSSVDTVVMMLPIKYRTIVQAFVDFLIAVSSIYLLKISFDFLKRQQKLGVNHFFCGMR